MNLTTHPKLLTFIMIATTTSMLHSSAPAQSIPSFTAAEKKESKTMGGTVVTLAGVQRVLEETRNAAATQLAEAQQAAAAELQKKNDALAEMQAALETRTREAQKALEYKTAFEQMTPNAADHQAAKARILAANAIMEKKLADLQAANTKPSDE